MIPTDTLRTIFVILLLLQSGTVAGLCCIEPHNAQGHVHESHNSATMGHLEVDNDACKSLTCLVTGCGVSTALPLDGWVEDHEAALSHSAQYLHSYPSANLTPLFRPPKI